MRLMEYLRQQFGGGAAKPAPVIADPADRQTDQAFRLPSDPPHVIRIHHESLEYVGSKLFDKVTVVAYSDPRIAMAADSFMNGSEREIQLRRYLKNPSDPYAIEVVGLWRDQNRVLHQNRIGWLPPQTARAITQQHTETHLTARVQVMHRLHGSTGAWFQIEIWGIGGSDRSVGE